MKLAEPVRYDEQKADLVLHAWIFDTFVGYAMHLEMQVSHAQVWQMFQIVLYGGLDLRMRWIECLDEEHQEACKQDFRHGR